MFWISALIAGLIMGFLSGFLGIGAGTLMVPTLFYIFHLTMKQAIATSLFIMIFASLSGFFAHRREGQINLKLGFALGIAGMVGAQLGGFSTAFISNLWLKILFGVLLLFCAIQMLLKKSENKKLEIANDQKKSLDFDFPKSILTGLGAGYFSGLLGVGGAFLLIPAMHIILKVPMKIAIGTSLIAVFLNAISATSCYLWKGEVEISLGLIIGFAAVIAAQFGAKATVHFSSAKLRKMFAWLLVAIGILMLIKK